MVRRSRMSKGRSLSVIRGERSLLTSDSLTKSPVQRRHLLLKKGIHLKELGMVDDALKSFRKAIERFEEAGDVEGAIDGWFQIRGIMQERRDRKREREASETLLTLGAERMSPAIAGLTLVMLAQQDIEDGLFEQAATRIERAVELAPQNPAVTVIAADLKTRIPP